VRFGCALGKRKFDMTADRYEYYGLKASTWDLSRGDTSTWTDRLFYLDVVRRYGEPVLDVGCGTGRILFDFAALGIDIEGIDDSPEMLEQCRSKAKSMRISIRVHQQKMEDLELSRRFATILVPSSSFQLLTDAQAAREAMRRFHAHLLPGGAIVTAFGFDWRPGEPLQTDWKLKFEKQRPQDGATVRSAERIWYDPQQQLWHDEERFEVERNGVVVQSELHRRSPSGRWYTQQQVKELLRHAGFRKMQSFKGFSREPATESDRLFVIVAVL
jgi:ubiquinone/menaquinone biosynthesis C-methylase UbiE